MRIQQPTVHRIQTKMPIDLAMVHMAEAVEIKWDHTRNMFREIEWKKLLSETYGYPT